MSDILKRAETLYDLGRWELALQSYQEYLLQYPEDPHALCQAAQCLLHLEMFGRASEYVDDAIALDPSSGYAHYIQAYIFYLRNLRGDARRSIDNALELEPGNSSYHTLVARLHAMEGEWLAAKDAAEIALNFAPHDAEAQIVRANALIRLKQYDEAYGALSGVLEQDPENLAAMVELGNFHLYRSDWKGALEVFQSALAVAPESEAAQDGMMSAMRARFPIYGLILRYFLWMNRFSKQYQQAMTYGLTFAARMLNLVGKEYPALAPLISVVLLFWRIFAYLTWTIRAGTTLLFRLNKYGRSLVSGQDVLESNLVGGLWMAALGCWAYTHYIDPFSLFGRVGIPVFLTLPLLLAGSFGTVTYGWPRKAAFGICGVMSTIAVVGLTLFAWQVPVGLTMLKIYFISLNYVLMLMAYLESVEPTRE